MKTLSPAPIAFEPLLTLSAGLLLGAILVAGHVTAFALGFFLLSVAGRLVAHRWRVRPPGLPLRLAMLAVAFGGGVLSAGTVVGIEFALGSVLILAGLKMWEIRGVRDFQVLALVGWFLGLCGLFFAQDLVRWLYVGLVCALVGAALVRFHRSPDSGVLWKSFRLIAVLVMQALPLVALLFVLCPRTQGGFRFTFGQNPRSGMTLNDRLEPGSVASLAMNQAMAFRVDFPDGWVPEASSLYWRGAVLWRGDGLVWTRAPRMIHERDTIAFGGPSIRQRFMLEPHGMRWLFALDRAESMPPGAAYEAGGALRSGRPVHSTLRYEVTSRVTVSEPSLLTQHLREASRLPFHVSPRLEALVDSWRETSTDSRAIVRAALLWFQQEGFTYTSDPGTYTGPEALDEFLFDRRAGFCEHYAAAFATLMRVAGIPSRVVIGYQGGEFNRLGQYVIVRQSEAHAWSEAWIEGEGWMRVDPTSVIAPGRLTVGLGSFLTASSDLASDAGGLALGGRGLRSLLRDVRLAWDNLNFQWDLRVLGFDEDHQRELFADLGLPHGRWMPAAAWVLLGSAPLLAGLALWLRRPGKPQRDPVVAAWVRFCHALDAAGVARAPGEGPRAFTERAATALPDRAEVIRRLGALYIGERYGRADGRPGEFARSVRAFGR